MQTIHHYLKRAGRKIFMLRSGRHVAIAITALMVYCLLYFSAILLFKSMSLTWLGLLWFPALLVLALMAGIVYEFWCWRDGRRVAAFLEQHDPGLQLSLRSSLDFLEGRSDVHQKDMETAYVAQVTQRIAQVHVHDPGRKPWGRYAVLATLAAAVFWVSLGPNVLNKFYNPSRSFGQTHLDLSEGSITIFEPEYTQIPGRTLPLKPGTFKAYPGSRVRFIIQLPAGAEELYIATAAETEPVPVRVDDEQQATHEFVLLEPTALRYFVADAGVGGKTEPYRFEIRQDGVPEVVLQSHTPEGVLNTMDPLIVEAEVKDDFGVKQLEAVITWEGDEHRINIPVPPSRKIHFNTKNQWFLSDLNLEDVEQFSIYLEATDNNPIDEPGVGRSQVLTYELESPDKKYDEFMELAKRLLDSMTHTLGDNLETAFARPMKPASLDRAETLGDSITRGLYDSLDLTNQLIGQVRETPNLTRMDQGFLFDFRNGLSRQARARSNIGLMYANLKVRANGRDSLYQNLISEHYVEERRVEDLTYELLLQLKLWAALALDRKQNELDQNMDSMEELLANAENMEQQELMEMFDKMMDELMSDFQEMMQQVAQQMEMTMDEFMNQEAMESMNQNAMEELRQQIMEALEAGDMETARDLMEQMRQQMENASNAMQNSMGQQSPEMQAMMQDMRELMGLLREIKDGEEGLERDTQALRQELDEEMGGNSPAMDPQQQQAYKDATERMRTLLTELSDKLAEYKTEDAAESIIREIADLRQQMEAPNVAPTEQRLLRNQIANQERMLDFLTRDGLDRLQEVTLDNLRQTEQLQDYLDTGEFLLSLESALKLESNLAMGERLSDRTVSKEFEENARPRETYQETRSELYKIIDALRNMQASLENQRQQYMQQQGEQRNQGLAERQAELQQMIQEFMEQTQNTFGGSQISERLKDIDMSMNQAQRRLQQGRLEGGIQYEQDALQKIGEMMEQLQQARQPNGQMPLMMSMRRNQGNQGDPNLESFVIPESEKQASKDEMKEAIRKRLLQNFPDSYGKEIKKYYEKLIEQ